MNAAARQPTCRSFVTRVNDHAIRVPRCSRVGCYLMTDPSSSVRNLIASVAFAIAATVLFVVTARESEVPQPPSAPQSTLAEVAPATLSQ